MSSCSLFTSGAFSPHSPPQILSLVRAIGIVAVPARSAGGMGRPVMHKNYVVRPIVAGRIKRLLHLLATTPLLVLAGCGSDVARWKEEALLHDGQKIIVKRYTKLGGRHEVGQRGSYIAQSLSFTLPGTGRTIEWQDNRSEDLGNSSFLPMLLDIAKGTPYLVAYPMGCLSYNKWGRPNPPYVVFKYATNAWHRIALADLPLEIKTPNLIFSSPDDEAKKTGQAVVSAETIKALNAGGHFRPEYETILREPLPKEQILAMCDEFVLYKGTWIDPRDPDARKWIDARQK